MKYQKRISIVLLIGIILLIIINSYFYKKSRDKSTVNVVRSDMVLYTGKINHIFFHSLVLYPQLAFQNDSKGKTYRDYMVTKDEFKKILNALYQNNFVLIDIESLYKLDNQGKVIKEPLYIPKGKKPLILSLDDLNYYSYMKGRGFADKLMLDSNGDVATQVITPDNNITVTRDGDVIPIIDDFVKAYPDFSIDGAKGIIAVTGFQGVLGYRTNASSTNRVSEIQAVKPIISQLKNTGWRFASHSYSHDHSFQINTISLTDLITDTEKWKNEVGSLVGPTNIYIGPFGQVFSSNDPRRTYLVSQGFTMLCGVGLDSYLHYFPHYVAMDRTDIDGYRLKNDSQKLKAYVGDSISF